MGKIDEQQLRACLATFQSAEASPTQKSEAREQLNALIGRAGTKFKSVITDSLAKLHEIGVSPGSATKMQTLNATTAEALLKTGGIQDKELAKALVSFKLEVEPSISVSAEKIKRMKTEVDHREAAERAARRKIESKPEAEMSTAEKLQASVKKANAHVENFDRTYAQIEPLLKSGKARNKAVVGDINAQRAFVKELVKARDERVKALEHFTSTSDVEGAKKIAKDCEELEGKIDRAEKRLRANLLPEKIAKDLERGGELHIPKSLTLPEDEPFSTPPTPPSTPRR